MEDNLKILKVEYLRSLLMGHAQILNLSLDDLNVCIRILKKWSQRRSRMGYPIS